MLQASDVVWSVTDNQHQKKNQHQLGSQLWMESASLPMSASTIFHFQAFDWSVVTFQMFSLIILKSSFTSHLSFHTMYIIIIKLLNLVDNGCLDFVRIPFMKTLTLTPIILKIKATYMYMYIVKRSQNKTKSLLDAIFYMYSQIFQCSQIS